MKVLEVTQKVTDGKIIIDFPQNFEGKEVLITVSETDFKNEPSNWASLPPEERMKILKRFEGSAKYPDTPIDKYEVYEQ